MKSSFCIDLQRFMLIPTKFPLSRNNLYLYYTIKAVANLEDVSIIATAFLCVYIVRTINLDEAFVVFPFLPPSPS